MQKQNIGIMDEGYFVPRGEIIEWINNLLDLNVTKIEQLGAGSVYCQIIDVIHPGKVSMGKINWKAKSEYQFIQNLKILQTAFDKVGIKRYVEVQKLAKAKYQDNLEFIQWLKRYFDLNCGNGDHYNAQQRRGNVVVDFGFATKNVVPKSFNGVGQIIPKTDVQPKKTTVNNVPARITTHSIEKREAKISVKAQKKDWEKLYKKEAEKSNSLLAYFQKIGGVVQSNKDEQSKLAMIEEILTKVLGNQNTQKMEVENNDEDNY